MLPAPGSREELAAFERLQGHLRPLFERVFPDPHEPRTVVVIPSLSLDAVMLEKIVGVQHYEERLLCMLMLLRMPRTRVVYLTSLPIDPAIIDYYLHLLPGVPGQHARRRLTLLSCQDGGPQTLTDKILERPRLLQRIREAIPDPASAHLTCFLATDFERTLAVQLGIPIFACDPAKAHLGSKSGSRKIFRDAGILQPDGREDLRDTQDMVAALAALKRDAPDLQRAVVKLEEGTSGEGNAVFSYRGAPAGGRLEEWVLGELPTRLRFEAGHECWEGYEDKFARMGGIVEAWIEGSNNRSPSVQCRIDPLDRLELISTHDQVLGGPSQQVFLGSTFPADAAYRHQIQEAGMRVGAVLRSHQALGRFGVDFVSVPDGDGWKHYAIEINLRKGGTTHTFRILQLLTDGTYDPESGLFLTPQGKPRFYYASDNLVRAHYRRLGPDDLMEVAVDHDLHFHAATQRGVFFHLIGALSGHGKLGLVCVDRGPAEAHQLYLDTVEVLDREALRTP